MSVTQNSSASNDVGSAVDASDPLLFLNQPLVIDNVFLFRFLIEG